MRFYHYCSEPLLKDLRLRVLQFGYAESDWFHRPWHAGQSKLLDWKAQSGSLKHSVSIHDLLVVSNQVVQQQVSMALRRVSITLSGLCGSRSDHSQEAFGEDKVLLPTVG